jgi:hypothetical protein
LLRKWYGIAHLSELCHERADVQGNGDSPSPQTSVSSGKRKTILRSMRIPVPPAAEQHRIVAKVDELMAICERLKADLGTARQRQATLAEALIESALEAA